MKIMTKFTQLEIETNDRYRSFRLDTDIQFETNIYRLTLLMTHPSASSNQEDMHVWVVSFWLAMIGGKKW